MAVTANLDNDAVVQYSPAVLKNHGPLHDPIRGSMNDVSHCHDKPPLRHGDVEFNDKEEYEGKPTDEDMRTLRRVSGKINWTMWTIAFTELCERFSYYGSTVLYANFVNKPLPPGSTTGAPVNQGGIPGALGMGTKAAQGINLCNQFFAFFMPLVGAWIADVRLGRFWTLHLAVGISVLAHTIQVAASAPSVIVHGNSSFVAFTIGLFCLCVGAGFFKANVAPLLAEQNEDARPRVEIRDGERVMVDPAMTNTRIFLYFYLCVNLGTLAGQIGMVYIEKHVGFWLAFLLPMAFFLPAPVVLWSQKKKYKLTPPTGSVLSKFLKMVSFAGKRSGWSKFSWEAAKPSRVPAGERPSWMTYDDAWVDEVRRGLLACKVFLFLPIFFLPCSQMMVNLTTQASTLELHGVPNDVLLNLNPISVIIIVPFIDRVLYPGLRRLGVAFTPIKRMALGFAFAALAMVASAVMQYFIYQKSPCGWYANAEGCDPAPINVWAQSLSYILIGMAEIFTYLTSLEYAFSKAPTNMKSLVMGVNLFMNAISAALGQAFVPLAGDPLLIWNYTVLAVIAVVGGAGFWLCFRRLDSEEDKWNMLKKSEYLGMEQPGRKDGDAL